MTGPETPRLKSLTRATARPQAAGQAAPRAADGAPKVVGRQAVLSALHSDPSVGDGRRPIAWLHITAPGRGTVPTATFRCACGRDRSAVGHRQVLALVDEHTTHRDTCPLRQSEERNAA